MGMGSIPLLASRALRQCRSFLRTYVFVVRLERCSSGRIARSRTRDIGCGSLAVSLMDPLRFRSRTLLVSRFRNPRLGRVLSNTARDSLLRDPSRARAASFFLGSDARCIVWAWLGSSHPSDV